MRAEIVGGWGGHGDFQGVVPWNRGSDREYYDRDSTCGQNGERKRKQERKLCDIEVFSVRG